MVCGRSVEDGRSPETGGVLFEVTQLLGANCFQDTKIMIARNAAKSISVRPVATRLCNVKCPLLSCTKRHNLVHFISFMFLWIELLSP